MAWVKLSADLPHNKQVLKRGAIVNLHSVIASRLIREGKAKGAEKPSEFFTDKGVPQAAPAAPAKGKAAKGDK